MVGTRSLSSGARSRTVGLPTLKLRLPRDPLQFRRQHVQRFRQRHAAAFGQPFRNHDAFFGRIESLQRRMQQKRLAVIAGKIAGLRDQQQSGFRLTIASSDANPPKAKPRSPAALNSPVSVSSEPTKLSLPATQPRRDSGSTR